MSKKKNDEKLLKEIRDKFSYCKAAWEDTRAEAAEDMRFVSGDSWDPKEKKARKDANRPCVAFDELGQYINQLINDVRAKRRAIKISPVGDGANDETAELRGNIIRGIEYQSNAQIAYATGFENAVNRSYGWWRVQPEYCSPTSFLQQLRINRIANPDSVWPDPTFKEYDASDMNYCFVGEYMPKDIYKEKFPDAEVTTFTPEHLALAPDWLSEENILVCEYWKVEVRYEELLLIDDKHNEPQSVFAKDFVGKDNLIIDRRNAEVRKITQHITNGIEVLEKNEWAGKWIPIIGCFGKELWIDKGRGVERIFMSLIRLARDPQQAYNYARTSETELVGMTPKTPWIAYEGQLGTHEAEWQNAGQVPINVLQALPVLDATGQQLLPLPQRMPYAPQVQPLEIYAESCKRAIQAAMGRYNTSVGKHDTNAQSGVAIQELDAQSDKGSFHFIDNYERSLQHTGRVLDDLMDVYYDTSRDVPIQKEDGTFAVARINDKQNKNKSGKVEFNDAITGDHNSTVSTGPSFDSQRQEAQSFADTLIANLKVLPLPPQQAVKLLALAIKLKDLGPIGDAMTKIIDPPEQGEQLPPQVAAMMQQAQMQIQAMGTLIQKLQMEKAAKVVDNHAKIEIAKIGAAKDLTIEGMKAESAGNMAKMQAHINATQNFLDYLSQVSLAEAKTSASDDAQSSQGAAL